MKESFAKRKVIEIVDVQMIKLVKFAIISSRPLFRILRELKNFKYLSFGRILKESSYKKRTMLRL